MTDIIPYAESLGWTFVGYTGEQHLKFTWEDPDTGVKHIVITGNPRVNNRSRTSKNYKTLFNVCMKGACQHQAHQLKRTTV